MNYILPLHIGFFVYQYAKLRMLQFYYDFIDMYVERPLFQYCEMDTDSAYIALAGETIDDLITCEHREHYFRHRSEWLPAECCDEHENEYVPARAVDNALTLFKVWPIKNVGAIFGNASAAAHRITCLRVLNDCFVPYTNKIQHKYTTTYSDMLFSNIILNLRSTLHISIVQLAGKSVQKRR